MLTTHGSQVNIQIRALDASDFILTIMTTDREKAGLRGLVQRTETKAKRLGHNNVDPFGEYEWIEEVSVYDKEGKLLERYSPENQVLEQEPIKQIYIYDDCGRLIEKQGYSEDGSTEDLWKYNYDDAGNLTESVYTNIHGISKNRYFYDERGNTLRVESYDGEDSSLRFVQRYSFNYEEDKKIEERYDGWKQTTFFNDAGKKTRVERYSYDLLDTVEIYNEDEQRIERRGFSSDGSLMSHDIHTYDERGNLIASYMEGHSDIVDCSYEYDEWNNLLKSTTKHKNSAFIDREEIYIYKYDSQNNWTKKIQTDSNKTGVTSTAVYERTITYF